MKRDPIAVIDVGSNTIRMLIVEPRPDRTYAVLDDVREAARLASGLHRSRRISVAGEKRALAALKRMAAILRARRVRRKAVIATSAIRSAVNGSLFVEKVLKETGLRVRVITGAQEARLAFESVAASFELSGKTTVVADVGGGSTEIVLAHGNSMKRIYSLPLGAVSLTETFLTSDPVSKGQFRAMREEIRRHLAQIPNPQEIPGESLIASGGSATAVAQIGMFRLGLSDRSVQGFELGAKDLRDLLDGLRRRTLEERKAIPGLSPDRADIIIAGTTIFSEVVRHFHIKMMKVSARGIRHALVNRMISRGTGSSVPISVHRSRLASAESFGKSLRFDRKHAEHVERLALTLFDQMAESFSLLPESRDLLAAAALLHDVGYVVGYKKHHKHSYHLIVHAPLDGFTPREREIIAEVARYHRGVRPKKKHAPWKSLPPKDRKLVTQLAAILRIADALDRTHAQRVEKVDCRVTPKYVRLTLFSNHDLEVERERVEAKADLFRKAFDREFTFLEERQRNLKLLKSVSA